MSLRKKLLLISLIVLVLPWSAWQYLREMERFLRHSEERAALATAQSIARAFSDLSPRLRRAATEGALYVRRADSPIYVDGYDDEWSPGVAAAQAFPAGSTDPALRVALAEDDTAIYAMIRVADPHIVYDRAAPGQTSPNDHLLLTVESPDGLRHYRIATAAPGWVQATLLGAGPHHARIRGEWQETPGGYQVELRIPRDLSATALGFAAAEVSPGGGPATVVGTGPVGEPDRPLSLVGPRDVRARRLAELAPENGRVWLVGPGGWVLAHAGILYRDRPGGQSWFLTRWFRSLLYRHLMDAPLSGDRERDAGSTLRLRGDEVAAALSGNSATRWQAAPDQATVVLSAAAPITPGGPSDAAVVVEEASDALLLRTNQAMMRLLGQTTLAFGVALAALFIFASVLSTRIRRLRDAAEAAVTEEGEMAEAFPQSTAADELGDLSRSFAHTLGALRDYTDYLKSLAGKLSHELRTPLAVVGSSLENLQQEPLSDNAHKYLERARGGTARLSRILQAMSEARRLEQTLRSEESERFDLADLVRACMDGYRDMDPQHVYTVTVPEGGSPFVGVPDLIAQMLDKLVDNARDFTPNGGWINVELVPAHGAWELRVENQGPQLPERMQGRLFDSMVSLRESEGDTPHLGLGLYIVRLVADLHHGGVRADDLRDGTGVRLSVLLAGTDAPSSRPR